jgi:hypothetical protein
MYLNRPRFRVVNRDDRGRVIYRKRYVFGDEVDTSKMDENHVDRLVASGALVDSEDDLGTRPGRMNPYPGSQVTGAATGEAADHSEIAEDADEDEGSERTDGEVVDQYSGMDYGELQDAAREADPPIPANQSADNLRAALREQASDDDE